MNRAAIRTAVQALGYGADTQAVAAQNTAMDMVLLELAGEREWSWLHTSTTGTLTIGSESVTKPSDLVVPTGVRLTYGTQIEPVLVELDAKQIERFLHEDDGTDLPEFWSWIDRTIKVYPRPDLAYSYTLDYIKEPNTAAFANDSDAPPFNLQFHPVMVWGVVRALAYRQRDQVGYGQASDEFAKAKLNFSQADRRGDPDHVVDWAGWSLMG